MLRDLVDGEKPKLSDVLVLQETLPVLHKSTVPAFDEVARPCAGYSGRFEMTRSYHDPVALVGGDAVPPLRDGPRPRRAY